jgi:hypothetical protein
MCNCGNKAEQFSYIVTHTESGQQFTYKTDQEAQAAVRRSDGKGVIRKVAVNK